MSRARGGRPVAQWILGILRTPLLTKLVLADLVINAAAFLMMQWTPAAWVKEVTFVSLAVVLVLNAALVAVALRPLAILEDTARRVSEGEPSARADLPPIADRNLVRIADTLNTLLDHVEAERLRVRALTVAVVAAGDQERARIARELHDGIAQSLSAVDLLLAAALAEANEPHTRQRLLTMRDIVAEASNEARVLSHNVHPRVLDDLGLCAALHQLARRTGTAAEVVVNVPELDLPPQVASVLYRVAQEAIHNAVKHASARRITVEVLVREGTVALEVVDNGVGFDRVQAHKDRRGIGLFVMEERLHLIGGTIAIDSWRGAGTRLRAQIPLVPAGLA